MKEQKPAWANLEVTSRQLTWDGSAGLGSLSHSIGDHLVRVDGQAACPLWANWPELVETHSLVARRAE